MASMPRRQQPWAAGIQPDVPLHLFSHRVACTSRLPLCGGTYGSSCTQWPGSVVGRTSAPRDMSPCRLSTPIAPTDLSGTGPSDALRHTGSVLASLPRSGTDLRAIADMHGGYVALADHGMFYLGYPPLFAAARMSRALRRQNVALITGTQGKTTTLRAVRHLLGLPLDNWTESSNNVRGEVAWTVLRERRGTRIVPVEAADGIGMMANYARWLKPQVSTILNVGAEHLSGLGSLTAAAHEMAPAVAVLPADGWAVLNVDDPHVRALAERTSARVLWFGRDAQAQVRIVDVTPDSQRRIVVTLAIDEAEHVIATQLVGEHYAHVVAASVATGLALGVPVLHSVARLTTLPVTPRRLEPKSSTSGATILGDDFKTTPETINAGLAEVAQWPAVRRWVVIGELWMLPDANVASHYRSVAAAIARVADTVITVGQPWLDYADAWRGLDVPVTTVVTVAEATARLADATRPGDLIYLKGDEGFRLRRITLALSGREVTCNRIECRRQLLCDVCPDLAR